jgi:hypothetical protein
LGDRGYDADWFREALIDKKITPCIPGRKSRDKPVKYDKRRYTKRNRIKIMFGRLKDWRRVATRYDRSPKVFLSAIALAATVIFWLRDAVTGPASRIAYYRLQDQGQFIDHPVLDPYGGRRDETFCWVGCVAREDCDLRHQRAWQNLERDAGRQ